MSEWELVARIAGTAQDLDFAPNALFPILFPMALVFATRPSALQLQLDARPIASQDTTTTQQ